MNADAWKKWDVRSSRHLTKTRSPEYRPCLLCGSPGSLDAFTCPRLEVTFVEVGATERRAGRRLTFHVSLLAPHESATRRA